MAELQNVFQNAQVQPFNPLQAAQTITNIQRTSAEIPGVQAQSQMLTASALAQKALGQIVPASIGPDGQPDYKMLMGHIISDPRTAPLAPQLITAVAGADRSVQEAVKSGLDSALTQMTAVSKEAAPILFAAQNGATVDELQQMALAAHQRISTGPSAIIKPGDADPLMNAIMGAKNPNEVVSHLSPVVARGQTAEDSWKVMNGESTLPYNVKRQVDYQAALTKDYETDLAHQTQAATNARAILPKVQGLLESAKPGLGPGADFRQIVAQGLSALGASPDEVNQAMGAGLDQVQLLQRLTAKMAVAAPTLFGFGKNEFQNQQFSQSLPATTDTPEAQKQVWGLVSRFANMPLNEKLLYDRFKLDHPNANYNEWQSKLNSIRVNNMKTLQDEPANVQKRLEGFNKVPQ